MDFIVIIFVDSNKRQYQPSGGMNVNKFKT